MHRNGQTKSPQDEDDGDAKDGWQNLHEGWFWDKDSEKEAAGGSYGNQTPFTRK